jgi:hypothetical protein
MILKHYAMHYVTTLGISHNNIADLWLQIATIYRRDFIMSSEKMPAIKKNASSLPKSTEI